MKPLTPYGQMAEKHWRAHRPAMVAALEAKGHLHVMLLEAEEQTEAELDALRRQFMQPGTEVTTDIVFLRKRLPREPPTGPAWSRVVEVTN